MVDYGKNCIILTRVSTSQQDYQFQLDALYKYANELGLNKPLIDISTKESGFRSMESKDGFKRVIEFLKENDCRIVLCTELSRLAREKIILEQIKEWFVTNKIQLYVKDQNFRLFNDEGEVDMSTDIIFSVYASMAQSEMREKKKRMTRGLKSLLASGYSLVGPTPFGYVKKKTDEKVHGKYRSYLDINEEQAKQVSTIFEWALHGINGDKTRCSARAITLECVARGFDPYLTSISNVKKCLTNEGYTGSKTTHNRRKNPAYWEYGHKDEPKYIDSASHTIKYPQIITKERFEAVQKRMYSNYTHLAEVSTNVFADKSRTHVSILSKLLVCPVCGHFMSGSYRMRDDRLVTYYRCGQQHEKRGFFAMPPFDTAVWSFCKSNWETFSDFLKQSSGTDTTEKEKRIANIEQQIETVEKEREDYQEQILSLGRMSPKLKAKVKKKIDEFDKKIESLRSSILKEEEAIATISHMINLAHAQLAVENSKEEMRKYVQLIVDRVLPVYRTVRLCIMEVTINHGVAIPYTTHDEQETSSNVSAYLIVDGIQGVAPKLRCVYSPLITVNKDNGTFMFGDKVITTEDIFADKEEVFSIQLPFDRLDIYQNDKPKTRL